MAARSTAIALAWVMLLVLLAHLPAAAAAELPQLVLAPALVGGDRQYEVRQGDSLTGIGARFGISTATLAADNGLRVTARLNIGQQLYLNNRHLMPLILKDGLLINLPQRLIYFFSQGRLERYYPIGLGRADWPTPTGEFAIVNKRENPVWNVPKSIQEEMRREGKIVQTRVPPGPENPLGQHWLGLSIPGYGIHGTIAPTSVYQFRSHGCIRTHPDDIAALFERVTVGTPGRIIYKNLLLGESSGRIYLEVHPDIYRRAPSAVTELDDLLNQFNLHDKVDRQRAITIIGKQEGIARDITKRSNDP